MEPVIVDMADANFTCPDGFAPGTSTCTSVSPGGWLMRMDPGVAKGGEVQNMKVGWEEI